MRYIGYSKKCKKMINVKTNTIQSAVFFNLKTPLLYLVFKYFHHEAISIRIHNRFEKVFSICSKFISNLWYMIKSTAWLLFVKGKKCYIWPFGTGWIIFFRTVGYRLNGTHRKKKCISSEHPSNLADFYWWVYYMG